MFIYRSDFTILTTGSRTARQARAQQAGADGAMIPLTANLCLVSSSVPIAFPPAGVSLLLNTSTDLDILVPNGVVNFLNNNLGTTYPLQTHTWRAAFRRLFTIDGAGKWGVLAGDLSKLHFGAESIDI